MIVVAVELLVEPVSNSRGGGRAFGDGSKQILGAVKAGAEGEKFRRRRIISSHCSQRAGHNGRTGADTSDAVSCQASDLRYSIEVLVFPVFGMFW